MSDWDPAPPQREFYRHQQTGDLGWLVKRGGREHMRFDRPDFDHVIAVTRDDKGAVRGWEPVKAPAPMLLQQAAIVAFEANRALGRFTGQHEKWKAWIDMPEERRRKWIEDGPPEVPGPHRALYDAVMAALEPYTR